jgi:hypothetical protein
MLTVLTICIFWLVLGFCIYIEGRIRALERDVGFLMLLAQMNATNDAVAQEREETNGTIFESE